MCLHIKGGNPCASGTEAALQRCTHHPPPHRSPAWNHLHVEDEAPQKTRSDTEQRRLVWVDGRPWEVFTESSPWGRPPAPSVPWGAPFLFPPLASFLETRMQWGVATFGPHGHPGGKGGAECWCLAKALTHRCTSDRLSAGRTSGGSRTWGLCPCPHSCAGSLRFHSYRLLVRPKVYIRVYKQNDNKND